MSQITFTEGNVLSNQFANKTGNISQTLYNIDNNIAKNGESKVTTSFGAELEKTNPYDWNTSPILGAQGFDGNLLGAYINQVNLSSYYQNNPWEVLEFSQKTGGIQQPLGGPIRRQIPSGSFPGAVGAKTEKQTPLELQ